MDITQNPFYILGATPRDDKQKIFELAEERSLHHDLHACQQARSDLGHPKKRLSAEIAWLPGLGPARIKDILALLDTSTADLIGIGKLPSLTRTNILAAGLSRITQSNASFVARWIRELAKSFEEVDMQNVLTMINEERSISGFPEVTDLYLVESELQERRRYYRQVMKSSLDTLLTKDLLSAITTVVSTSTNNGEIPGPILIHDLVDAYEVEAQEFLIKEMQNINALAQKAKTASDEDISDSSLLSFISQLSHVVRNWDIIAQPIQVSTKSRGLRHKASGEASEIIRNLALYLYNQHGKLEMSRILTDLLRDVFTEVVDIHEKAVEDIDALKKIREKKEQDEKWRNEFTYVVNISYLLYSYRFVITPEGIDWKGHHWNFNDIKFIRWGGTRHYTNNIYTGTNYIVAFGSGSLEIIKLSNKDIYSNIIDRLWKAVGVRLLNEYLEGFRNGKRYNIGDYTIDDYGIDLEHNPIFGQSRQLHCVWNDIEIWNEAGSFCIAYKTDKRLKATFSYLEVDNIHVLEAMIRTLWKQGGDQLSTLLNE